MPYARPSRSGTSLRARSGSRPPEAQEPSRWRSQDAVQAHARAADSKPGLPKGAGVRSVSTSVPSRMSRRQFLVGCPVASLWVLAGAAERGGAPGSSRRWPQRRPYSDPRRLGYRGSLRIPSPRVLARSFACPLRSQSVESRRPCAARGHEGIGLRARRHPPAAPPRSSTRALSSSIRSGSTSVKRTTRTCMTCSQRSITPRQ